MTYAKFTNLEHKQNTINLARFVASELDKLLFIYWLDFGTLLGYIRENDLIKNDIDIDFGIRGEDNNIDLAEHFRGLGFKVFTYKPSELVIQKLFNGVPPKFPVSYGIRDTQKNCVVDIYPYYAGKGINFEGDSRFIATWIKDVIHEVPAHFLTSFKSVYFLNRTLYIPRKAEEFLALRYGDWKTPREVIDVAESTDWGDRVVVK